jgi:DNA-3-methyladenine glycosylase II
MTPDAAKHLRKVDPTMARLIRDVGLCTFEAKMERSTFEALIRAVAHQQLHGKAAESILRRFKELFPGKRFPGARDLASVSDDNLRAVGFSNAKVASLRDIAAKTLAGVVPTPRQIRDMDDEDVIRRLITLRGVGRWTVEMLLIFKFGRPDVLPVDDFGVRNGFRIAYDLDALPPPKALLVHGERWRPYRTTASWYLWRAVDRASARAAIAGVNA